MAADIQIVPARGKHCRSIARRMRAADVAECKAMAGLSPFVGLRLSMKRSRAFTALYDGRPEAMFGTSDLNVLAGIGSVWLLGTDTVECHPREFLRLSAEWRPKLFERYSVLRNAVSESNAASLRWLKWLGADFLRRIEVGGQTFVLFELRKQPCASTPAQF